MIFFFILIIFIWFRARRNRPNQFRSSRKSRNPLLYPVGKNGPPDHHGPVLFEVFSSTGISSGVLSIEF